MKRCTKCGETKSLANFGVRSASPDGLMYVCRSCYHGARPKREQKVSSGEAALVDKLLKARDRDLVLVVTAERLRDIVRLVSRGETDEALEMIREVQMRAPTLEDLGWHWRSTPRAEIA